MSFSRPFMIACLVLAYAGCVVGASDGGASDPGFTPLEVPIVPRQLCELDEACGGDVVGEWTTEAVCASYMTAGRPPVANCQGSTIEAIIDDVEGAFAFAEDGSYSANMRYAGQIVVTAPMSCLRSGLSCAELIRDGSDPLCVERGDRCVCTRDWELESDGKVHGSYTTSDSRIEFSNDGPVRYCAQEDRLTMRTIAELSRDPEALNIELQVELVRK